MGKLVEGGFGGSEGHDSDSEKNGKKQEAKQAETESADSVALGKALEAEKAGDDRAEGIKLLSENVKFFITITEGLQSLSGRAASAEVLATAREYWANFSAEELIAAASESTEADWQKYPGRYEALTVEYRSRIGKIFDRFLDPQ